MKEKFMCVIETLFESFLSKDGFEKQRKRGVFTRKQGSFEQTISVLYDKTSGEHSYKLSLHMGDSEVDRLCADLTRTKRQKNILLDFGKADWYHWRYVFFDSDDGTRLAMHIYGVICGEFYPLLTQYSDYGRIIRAYEMGEEAWRRAVKSSHSNEQTYKIIALYLLSGYVYAARHEVGSVIGRDIEEETVWLGEQIEGFRDKKDYRVFFTGHENDRYNRWFINPDRETIKERIREMTGGHGKSTAFLIWQDDNSYIQMGGTPAGYTVEIRIYDEKGGFVHKKARYPHFLGEVTKEIIRIDGCAVKEQSNRILTWEDAAACVIAFGERKEFPDMFEWDDITDWF